MKKICTFLLVLAIRQVCGQVVINELMYHPYEPWPPSQPYPTTNDTEYIEIYNAGTGTVDLTNYRFDNGVDFEFPPGLALQPGAYLVIADNIEAFTNYYPAVTNVIGNFQGALDNGGERVTLSRLEGEDWVTEDTIRYYDYGPSDGEGPSLELIHPGFARLRNQYYGDWQSSADPDGTPGEQNSVYDSTPLPVVGDVLHDPPLPFPNSSVTITCRATGRDGDALQSVTAQYRRDSGSWSNATMYDNGQEGDVTAADGVYTVRLPPYGSAPMSSGQILEFRIQATDSIGSRTFPAASTSGVLTGPYSYLCYFGDDTYTDCDFAGEYLTYHILMTPENKTLLETRGVTSDVLLDATLVTSEGDIFYNCGARFRGGSSRNATLGGYRVDLPAGESLDGFSEINLNHLNALNQYVGMTIFGRTTDEYASKVRLTRVWLNSERKNPNQSIYVRLEGFGNEMMRRLHPDGVGNRYWADGDFGVTGYLDYLGDTSSAYYSRYYMATNNPYWAWDDLIDFCSILNQPASQYPTILTNRMNVRLWARHFATQVCVDNNEPGFGSPHNSYGDELKLHVDPATGQFDIFPWDMDAAVGSSALLWGYNVGVAAPLVRKFLFNPPVIPYYVGDVHDIMSGVMSHSEMDALFTEMGSKMAGNKGTWLSTLTAQRNGLLGQINTNLSVVINGSAAVPVANFVAPDTGGIEQHVVIDQDFTGWTYLGDFEFAASGSEYVRVAHEGGTANTLADAIKLTNAVTTLIIDNADPAFSTAGTWGSQSAGYNGSLRKSTEEGAYATWGLSGLSQPGTYSVFAYSVSGSSLRIPVDSAADFYIAAGEFHVSLSLNGTAPQNYTSRIRVNGSQETAFDTRNNAWTMPEQVVMPGGTFSTLNVEALSPDGDVLATRSYTIVADRAPQSVSGAISGSVTWDGASGVYHVTDNVTIGSGNTLTIESNTVIAVASGKSITVSAGGTLAMNGTEGDPIYIFPRSGATWTISVSGGGASFTARHTHMAGGRVSVGSGATLLLEDGSAGQYSGSDGIVAASSASSVVIRRMIVSDYAKTVFNNTPTLIEESLFENMSLRGIEFINAAVQATVRRTTVRDATGGAAVDGIVFDGCSAGLVTNGLVRNVSGTGVLADGSVLTVCDTLVHEAGTGMAEQGASSLTQRDNTIADCATGLSGSQTTVTNTIIWDVETGVSSGPATVGYCDIELPGTNAYEGTANINRNPWFKEPAAGDYRLQAISPCLTAGASGDAMGPVFPVGANPAAPSNLAVSNVTGASIEIAWQDNSSDEKSFEIQRAVEDGAWEDLAQAAAGQTTYVDGSVIEDTLYRYRVRSAHARGASGYTDPTESTTALETTTQLLIDSLRITEIMYNLPGDDAAEFIEVKNVGAQTVNVSGLYFDNGRYVFPPATTLAAGEIFLLVRNATAFSAVYPGVTFDAAFLLDDGLDNAGENIWIKTPDGTKVVDVDYNDAPPWPELADGGGYSLVLVDEAEGPPYDASRWRASTEPGGSPGEDDPAPPFGTIVINEILTHQDKDNPGDWVELYNPTTNAIDISYWYLSDSAGVLTNFQVPNPTIVPAGGYVVFTEYHDFGVGALGAPGFALSELGEQVILSSGNAAGQLTSYRTTVRFGASAKDVTFGRYTRSDGEVDFTELSAKTFGAANAYPKVGPVVINEIMYNPAAGGKEFIELLNIDTGTKPLFDPANPDNTWQIDGGVEFTFPKNVTMAPGEHILVVSVAPDEFRAISGITGTAVQVYGPFDGSLNNAGESIKLYRPGTPEPGGFVPRIRVDRVNYDDDPPWPVAADNDGPSLERIVPSGYGNDPANWIAGSMGGTPGAQNNSAGLPSIGFQASRGSGIESNGTVKVRVTLTPAVTHTVRVHYAVSGGTATGGSDYTLEDGVLIFWPYETSKTIPLVIHDDSTPAGEPDETVVIGLSGAEGALLGGNRVYTYTIIDTDATSLAAPTISPTGTNFYGSIVVTLYSGVGGATIRYTTDGTRPDWDDKTYVGPITLTSSARLTARTFLGSYNAGSWSSELFLEQTPVPGWEPPDLASNIFERIVLASTDDAREANRGAMRLADATIPLGESTSYGAGFRFADVDVSQGITVTNAYLQFTAAAAAAGSIALRIYGEDVDNAATFTGSSGNISARSANFTTAFVDWNPPSWTLGAQDEAQRTPNIADVVNEILSRPGWVAGNALNIIVRFEGGTSTRSLHTYDGDFLLAAVLHIEWASQTPDYFWLGVETNGFGAVVGGNRWVSAGSPASVEASPDDFSYFAGWSGDVQGNTNDTLMTVFMDRERALTANFGESMATNDTPKRWLGTFFETNDYDEAAMSDTDHDGMPAWEEYRAGTDPTDPDSVLALRSIANSLSGYKIRWLSVTDRFYSVYRSLDLFLPWTNPPIGADIPGDPSGTNTYTDGSNTNSAAFYRIGVQEP